MIHLELPEDKVVFLIEVCKRLRGNPIVPQEAKAQAKELQPLLEEQLRTTQPADTG